MQPAAPGHAHAHAHEAHTRASGLAGNRQATGRWHPSTANADECAWISPGSAGGAGNVSTTTGSFAMQATWSNDTNRCDLSHATAG